MLYALVVRTVLTYLMCQLPTLVFFVGYDDADNQRVWIFQQVYMGLCKP